MVTRIPPSRTAGTRVEVVSPPTVSNATSAPSPPRPRPALCSPRTRRRPAPARSRGCALNRCRSPARPPPSRSTAKCPTPPAAPATRAVCSPLEPAPVEQGLPGRDARDRNRRRLLVTHALGLLRDHHRGSGRILRVGAARRHAEHLVAGGEALGARALDRARHLEAEHPRGAAFPSNPRRSFQSAGLTEPREP